VVVAICFRLFVLISERISSSGKFTATVALW